MITELDLRRELKQTGILLNAPIKTEFATEVYQRIAHRYDLEDLKAALSDLLDSEVRLTYPALNKRLREAKSLRVDASNGKGKAEEIKGTLCPEIMDMVAAVISGDKAALERYGMGSPMITPNCVVIGKDGRRRHLYIDHNQPGMDAARTTARDERGVLVSTIDLKAIKYQEIDRIHEPPPAQEWKETFIEGDEW
jgi:poly-gamma-glutamate capsule biosynthesis protein CapA/YwtB (metallophosphatase superfamily)